MLPVSASSEKKKIEDKNVKNDYSSHTSNDLCHLKT